MRVAFGIDNQRVDAEYDRALLKLGTVVHVTRAKQGQFRFSPNGSREAEPHAVEWISPSEWYVRLEPAWSVPTRWVERIEEATKGLVDGERVRTALARTAGDVPLGKAHLTKKVEGSRASVLYAAAQRLDLIQRLAHADVAREIFHHYQSLATYLSLTCFDLLGQPADWLDFGSWIEGKSAADFIASFDVPLDGTRALYREYQRRYGVKSGFFNFIDSVLAPDDREVLFQSIDFFRRTVPPNIADVPATRTDIAKYLFGLRNQYTHRARFDPMWRDVPQEDFAGESWLFARQELGATEWTTLLTKNWPDALVDVVRRGMVRKILALEDEGL